MYEAKYYTLIDNNKVRCNLCPHSCILKQKERGKCNVRINISGKLYSENYGKAIGLHSEPIEKKPLYHFYPGKQIYSIGSVGCNFSCQFCQNHHISHPPFPEDIAYADIDYIIKAVSKIRNICGISYTFNEPFVWFEYMFDIAKKAKINNLSNAVVTNGYINPDPLNKLLEVTDGFNVDLKSFDNSFYQKYTGAELKPVQNTLKYIVKKNIHLEIANLIIPGLNDDKNIFKKMIDWINAELGKDIPLHINRYFPGYKMNIEPTPVETIIELRQIALEKLNFVYCGNISSAFGTSDTVCPKCNKTVIKRPGHKTIAENIDDKGNCVFCKYKIAFCC